MIDINHPKLRIAQSMADKHKKNFCILSNDFGDYDVVSFDKVSPYVNNPRIVAEIYPSIIAQKVKPVYTYSAVPC